MCSYAFIYLYKERMYLGLDLIVGGHSGNWELACFVTQ